MRLSTQIASTFATRIVSIASDSSMSTADLTLIRTYTTQLADIVEGLDTLSTALIDDVKRMRVETVALRDQLAALKTDATIGEPT